MASIYENGVSVDVPYKKIVYTAHAEIRIEYKYISKEWIERAVMDPDKIMDAKDGKRKVVRRINGDKISVI